MKRPCVLYAQWSAHCLWLISRWYYSSTPLLRRPSLCSGYTARGGAYVRLVSCGSKCTCFLQIPGLRCVSAALFLLALHGVMNTGFVGRQCASGGMFSVFQVYCGRRYTWELNMLITICYARLFDAWFFFLSPLPIWLVPELCEKYSLLLSTLWPW